MSTPTLEKQLRSINKALDASTDTDERLNIFHVFTLVSVVQHEDKQNAILHLKYDLERQVQHTLRRRRKGKKGHIVDAYHYHVKCP
jgi:hypothetical protein